MTDPVQITQDEEIEAEKRYDYIVIGSGAGGGPVASNLARAGYQVLLLEAGGDEEPLDYQVPAFHARASENDDLKWDYFVRHYEDPEQSEADSKFVPEKNGVLYPRSGTLGGCTAHHAMVTVYPHDSDWNNIAEMTGDTSWSAENMRRYYKRITQKRYGRIRRWFYRWTGWNIGEFGYDGWLPVSVASPFVLLGSPKLIKLVLSAVLAAEQKLSGWRVTLASQLLGFAAHFLDMNAWSKNKGAASEMVGLMPISVGDGLRSGTRELLKKTKKDFPENLDIRLNTLVSAILFDETNEKPKANGVRVLEGKNLYRAATGSDKVAGPDSTDEIYCDREVIVCAGAFNTPQILMLSGIGPKDQLEAQKIEPKLIREGVGRNLQDRYEVGVVSRLKERFALLEEAMFRPPEGNEAPDPLMAKWLKKKSGPYATNGSVISVIKKSLQTKTDPDLYIFNLLGRFRGYYPGYSRDGISEPPSITWAILKGHTHNRAGRVKLASKDPRDTPDINFNYFDNKDKGDEADLDAVVEGLKFCRSLNENYSDLIEEEETPGAHIKTDEELAEFVRNEAWGHHASCSCPIGRIDDEEAVVDHRFRVIGAENLRIVDASVFPRIPGFFIVTPIYMIAEKAADVILADAQREG